MKKLWFLLLFVPFIAIEKAHDEFGISYRPFIKKPWHFRMVYVDSWSEQDWSEFSRNHEAVMELGDYCEVALWLDEGDRGKCAYVTK
ncbi:hypothetical protein MIS45_01455 [Wielerella bovis]|uniref:hypothetical protein n=1 Tax=Wielerella bovis TaxID=2917790 RepID=UPI00201A0C7D|nr:hypothetical protein [Wielerella bovis]ULJ69558.1 hypothetical protein MIS45_01455 [Wielerella bovis]